jgi:hypothetical protein
VAYIMLRVRVKRFRIRAARGSWSPGYGVVNFEERWVNMWYLGSFSLVEKVRRIVGAMAARSVGGGCQFGLFGREGTGARTGAFFGVLVERGTGYDYGVDDGEDALAPHIAAIGTLQVAVG